MKNIKQIIDKARLIHREVICSGENAHLVNSEGGCILWASSVLMAAYTSQVKAEVIGGSLHWPASNGVDEEGNPYTDYYSYQWEPDHPISIQARAMGLLPEVHVWIEIEGHVIDLSVKGLKKRFEELGAGRVWDLPDPFDVEYLTKEFLLQKGIIYDYDAEVTSFVRRHVLELCTNNVLPTISLLGGSLNA
jgi:hypothetical protein